MINYDKSYVIFSPNTPEKFRRFMRKPLGLRDKDLLPEYLGPIEIDGRFVSKFSLIVDKISKKIS